MLKSIRIQGFRGITDLKIQNLRKINLLVGRNNCGKTSVLEAIFVISNPNEANFAVLTSNLRQIILTESADWSLFFNKLNTKKPIELSADMSNPREMRRMSITGHTQTGTIQPVQPIPGLVQSQSGAESSQNDAAIDGINCDFEISEPGEGKIAKKYRSGIQFSPIMVSIPGPAGRPLQVPQLAPQRDQGYKESVRAGFSIPSLLQLGLAANFDQAQNEKRIPEIVAVLQEIEPKLQNLTLSKEGLVNADVGLPRTIPINMMGDGMIRLLSYLLLIANCKQGVVLIDEIENGLHVTSQKVLWRMIFQAAKQFDVQVIATTHSMECVMAFSKVFGDQPEGLDIGLLRIEKNNDEFKAVEFDQATLQTSVENAWEIR